MRAWILAVGLLFGVALAVPVAVVAQSRSDSRDYTAYNAYWDGTNWVSYASGYSNFLTTNTSSGDFNLYTGGTAAGAGLTRTLTPVMAVTTAGTVSATAFVGYTGSFGNVVATGYVSATGAVSGTRGYFGAVSATTMVTPPYDAGASTSVNWQQSNIQYTTASCSAFTFSNMVDGGSYALLVKGATSGTCSFTHTGLTFHLPQNYGATTASTHTLFTFLRMGTDVYVSWVAGY